jgi:N-methylhydantoinase A
VAARRERGGQREERRPGRANTRTADAIGVDTGGTFTDFVVRVGGSMIAFKLPSTPRAPERAVLEGLARAGAGSRTRVRHGSTVATNALLERRGARVTLLTTRGFEDVIEVGRQDRPDLYAIAPARTPPLVPAGRRIGVDERVGADGRALRALTPRAIRDAIRDARRSRPETLAIGLLHAWAHDRHERRLERALGTLGVPISRASRLCPEVREYERIATTVVNAYLVPRVSSYLRALARQSRARLEIVLSHGGTAPAGRAADEPVRQLLSGPAGGLRAARDAARACGFTRALTLDVGGTSTDCAYVEGDLPRRRAREIAGFPILLPVLDVHTVGAGGGSIASLGPTGLLEVGPASAGADPGPACYGRGGPPTLTDAMVVLGRLPLDSLAGGALDLDRDAAARAMAKLARGLSRDATGAALGVASLAEARMEAALRRVSVERGHDPRGAALVAFGGAGGLHACALAAALDCAAVVFPRHAGVLSAVGALAGGSRRERSRSLLCDARDRPRIERAFVGLERAVRTEFDRASRAGVRIERWVLARYRGQAHELELPDARDFAARFHAAHDRRFGFSNSSAAIEIVTVEARGVAAPEPLARAPRRAVSGARERRARVREEGAWRRARVIDRSALAVGRRIQGPAVVVDEGATLWIASGWAGRVHSSGAVVVTRPR